MWVQLLQPKQIEVRGEIRRYHEGDWVEVGKQLGLSWIANKSAKVRDFDPNEFAVKGAGVVIRGDATQVTQLDTVKMTLTGIALDGELLAFERTLIWHTDVRLRLELLHVGFRLLDTWQMAIPLLDYKHLALHCGDEPQREQTRTVIRDLRVPVYDPRLMFVKDAPETRDVLERWQADVTKGDDEHLALLRALYQVKPLLCALPVTWINQSYVP